MSILTLYCEKHNIVLHKGENMHILFTLIWNWALLLKLKLHKWLHGIHRPIIHYYALCWNEEKMLPFMFDYYKQFVDRFTLYDNYSDDCSESIILSQPNACIKKFSMDGEINDYIYQDIKNNCWKKSRGKADYVIVCDTDEFIYHNDIHQAITQLKSGKYSIVKPYGYNMYSTEYPVYDSQHLLTGQVKRGIRVSMFDKCILFDPHAIVEINYKPGAHECHPWGRVKTYHNEDIKLLHYKNIGLDQLLHRTKLYSDRLSENNIMHGYGIEYLDGHKDIIETFKKNNAVAQPIID